MGGLAALLRLELRLQARSFLYPATVMSTALICGVAWLVPSRPLPPRLTAFFVFMDPAIIGLSFVGAMVLMEKTQGTLAALAVTPLRTTAYVGAKAVLLTLVTFASGVAVALAATRGAVDLPRLILALALSGTLSVLVGLACVARAASMNQLVVTLLWISTLLYLPLLNHFGAAPKALAPLLAAIPSHAMLVLLTAGADPQASSTPAQLAAGFYLLAWIGAGWGWTVGEFRRAVVSEGR